MNLRQYSTYLNKLKDALLVGHGLALISIAQQAELLAKKNVTKNFTGRSGRKLSGRLLNSIFTRFETNRGAIKYYQAYVGSRGTPYAAIHEFGGKITPKKAKALWLKNYEVPSKYRRITPTEFFNKKNSRQANGVKYRMTIKNGKLTTAGVEENGNYLPLFFMRDFVNIPERPYLRPAVKDATKNISKESKRWILDVMRKRGLDG